MKMRLVRQVTAGMLMVLGILMLVRGLGHSIRQGLGWQGYLQGDRRRRPGVRPRCRALALFSSGMTRDAASVGRSDRIHVPPHFVDHPLLMLHIPRAMTQEVARAVFSVDARAASSFPSWTCFYTERAVELACRMGKRQNAQIILAYVVEVPRLLTSTPLCPPKWRRGRARPWTMRKTSWSGTG